MMETDSLGMRLKWIAARLGSVGAVQGVLEVSRSTYSRIVRGEGDISMSKAAELAEAAGVSLQWLATGAGDPDGESHPEVGCAYAPIQLYDVTASAGDGLVIDSECSQPILFDQHWLHNRLHVNSANCLMLRAKGDSMEPTIGSGAELMVDQTQQRGDGIYVLVIDGDLFVKRLQFLPTGEISVISDNSAYRPFVLEPQQQNNLRIIGRVVWHGERC